MGTSGGESGSKYPGEVINVYDAIEIGTRFGLDDYLDDIRQLRYEWWDGVFHRGAMRANGAAWGEVRFKLRVPSDWRVRGVGCSVTKASGAGDRTREPV